MTNSRRAELIRCHPRARTAGLAVVAFAVVAFVATACGGGGSGGSSSANAVAHLGKTTTTSTANSGPSGAGASAGGAANPTKAGTRILMFSACMRAHGVPNFPNPTISGNSVSLAITPSISGNPDFKRAQAACQHLLPGRPTAQHFTTAQQADYVKASACMRAHGINGFPDPDFSARDLQLAAGHEPQYPPVRGRSSYMSKPDPERSPVQLDRRKPMSSMRSFHLRPTAPDHCAVDKVALLKVSAINSARPQRDGRVIRRSKRLSPPCNRPSCKTCLRASEMSKRSRAQRPLGHGQRRSTSE